MPPKLLLADDSVTIQRVIELTFADEDVQVLTAGDGEAAIARVEADRPDIVLADIGMPKRSGYDVAAFIKERAEYAHIPVLLLTGAFEPVDEARAQAVRCDGVLVKPFEPQHVIARVRELLRDAGRRAQANVARAVSDVPRPVERLAPRPPEPRPPEAVPRAAGTDEALDDYFDRLDAAFANMSGAPGDAPPRTVLHPEVMRDGPVLESELDRLDAPAPQPPAPQVAPAPPAPAPQAAPPAPPDPPPASAPQPPPVATYASPPAPFEWPAPALPPVLAPAPREAAAPPPPREPEPPPAPPGTTLAGAFSALLAAEQGETGAAPVRFAFGPAAPAITDELVEAITRRVVERLAPDAVRDVVADVVKEISEKLIREEIARLRKPKA